MENIPETVLPKSSCSHPFPVAMIPFFFLGGGGGRIQTDVAAMLGLHSNDTMKFLISFSFVLFFFSFYRGNTRKPEKVEYCHPPTRLPFSSFR